MYAGDKMIIKILLALDVNARPDDDAAAAVRFIRTLRSLLRFTYYSCIYGIFLILKTSMRFSRT